MIRRYLLDTNALHLYVHDQRGAVERVRRLRAAGCVVGACPPVWGELWAGIEGSATRDANMKLADAAFPSLRLWPFGETAAREFGRLVALLKRRGRPMQAIDLQIAAVALTLGNCAVVSSDSDLLAVPDLPVEDWSRP